MVFGITISTRANMVPLAFNYWPQGSMNVYNIQSRQLPRGNQLPPIPRRHLSELARNHRRRQPSRLSRSHGLIHKAIAASNNSSIHHRRIQHKHSLSSNGSILANRFPYISSLNTDRSKEKKK
jgi:hypothetical protein